MKKLYLIATLFSLLLLQGCSTTTKQYSGAAALNKTGDNLNAKVLLMPLDVELSELTAMGFVETKADWTEQAIEHMNYSIEGFLTNKNANMEVYDMSGANFNSTDTQLAKLHEAVGYSILVHHMGIKNNQLPSKGLEFDYSLGKDANFLAEKTDADYALFVFVRDSYASGGRKAMQFFGALMGVGIVGGTQVGFASLVDLKSGDIVWFNRLISTSGDLRTNAAAHQTIQSLLKGFPSSS